MRYLYIPVVFFLFLAVPSFPAIAQVTIDQSRGVDPGVDYSSLTRLGPWDDRNYRLTKDDLAVLAPNEAELRDPIPAFFRVLMRKAWPSLPITGSAQYPRSALNIYRQIYGGYLVEGKLYNKVSREGRRFNVILEDGLAAEKFQPGESSRFLSGDARVTSPEGAAESAIKINPVDTNKVIAGSNGPGSGQKMHFSADGGDTWTETILPDGGTCCDPTVDWSSDGSFAYAATLGGCSMSGCSVWFYRSDDGGQTWNGLENVTPGDARRELTSAGSDKEYIHVDKHSTSSFKDNVYLTWHESNVMQFGVSTDNGNTFTAQSFSSLTDDLGIGSDITTDATGNVYYFWPAYISRTIRVSKSTNGGASFGSIATVAGTAGSFTFPVPSIDVRDVFIYASADTDLSTGPFSGSVYVSWTDSTGPTSGTASDNHARIQVAYSRDGGNSWNVSTPHETADSDSVDRWHQWLVVGDDGQIHVVFYDTRRDPTRTSVDLFYSSSSDGAQTWNTPQRVTSEMSPNISDSFEFGDYNGLDIVLSDLIAIFTDNRNESGGSGDSVDVYANGIPVCLQPAPPTLSIGNVTASAVDLGWTAVSGVNSYNVYRSNTDCSDSPALITSTALTSFSDSGVVPGGMYHYVTRSVQDGCESNDSNCVSAILAPRLIYENHSFCDGNGDGFADPGETIVMPVTLLNNGDFDATGITATLATTTPGVTVVDGATSFPDLTAGNSGQSISSHFSWKVGASVPCGSSIDFTLNASATEGMWAGMFQLLIGNSTPILEVSNQTSAVVVAKNSASTVGFTPDLTVPVPASSVTVVPPTLSGYTLAQTQALIQMTAVSPLGAVQTLKSCDEAPQSSYDLTDLYNGPSGGPGTWSLCVSTGIDTSCTGIDCSRQVGPWADLDVSGGTITADGVSATCSPNSGIGACGPGEISSVPAGEPPLRVGPESPNSITVESDPEVTAYNVYIDILGDWFSSPAQTCFITSWTDNGDGTVTLDVPVPNNSWILVTGSNADGEGLIGPSTLAAERSQTGTWNLCGVYP